MDYLHQAHLDIAISQEKAAEFIKANLPSHKIFHVEGDGYVYGDRSKEMGRSYVEGDGSFRTQRWPPRRVAKQLDQSCKQISRYLNHHPN